MALQDKHSTHTHTLHTTTFKLLKMHVCHNAICQIHTSSRRLLVQHDTASYYEKRACGNRWHCSWNVKSYHHTFHRLTISWLSVPLTYCGNNLTDEPFKTRAIMSLHVGTNWTNGKFGKLFKTLTQKTYIKVCEICYILNFSCILGGKSL
jgi:hypothetical protein